MSNSFSYECSLSVARQQWAKMVEYLKLKLAQEDWHGVADAAMDLRELEARIKAFAEVLQEPQEDTP